MLTPNTPVFPAARSVALWLWIVCTFIVIMVAVGGITRITESGLSMVNWKPLTGFMPPANEAEWQAEFAHYKETPQYVKFSEELGGEMSLAHFKEIFFWEFVHRVLGRVLGLVYAVPLFFFMIRGMIPKGWRMRLWIGLALGGGQGFLGWFMVKSGLVDRPYVSHFRLAAHLSLAIFVFAYLLWTVLDLQPFWSQRTTNFHRLGKLRKCTMGFIGLVILQIFYGAFTAGLRAGYLYNTWPLMGKSFLPSDAHPGELYSLIGNLFSNPVMVQFIHRNFGILLVALGFALWTFAMKSRLTDRQKFAFNGLLVVLTIQFTLGVSTLVSGMNIVIAVSHQVCACFLIASLVWVLHELYPPRSSKDGSPA